MNFRLFIYYCAVGGGWAAFLAWGLLFALGIGHPEKKLEKAPLMIAVLTGLLLGGFVASAVGFLDALLNSAGTERLKRTAIAGGVGLVGGMLGGLFGQLLFSAGLPLVIGWIITGVFIGSSIGVYDLIRASSNKGDMRIPIKRTLNGIYGGFLGGLLGGLPFGLLMKLEDPLKEPWDQPLALSKLAIGLVILGLLIGLLIALSQVFLKESWIRLESGRRAGKEMMLNKEETLIGRAEVCDIGIFGEQGIEKQHARIVLQSNRYYLEDVGTPGGTFLNDQRIDGRKPLQNGDRIQVGSAMLRFGEREKKKA